MKYENIFEIIAKNPRLKDLDQETKDQFNDLSDAVLIGIKDKTFSNDAFPDRKIIKDFAISKVRVSSNDLIEKEMIGDIEYKYLYFDVKISIFPGSVRMGFELRQRNKQGKLEGKTHQFDYDLNELNVVKLRNKIKSTIEGLSCFGQDIAPMEKADLSKYFNKKAS